jgi:hypothetical protein
MNDVLIIGALATAVLIYMFFKDLKDNKQIAALEVKKAEDEKQLGVLKTEQAGLKDAAVASQINATEEQKKDFWNAELNSKSDTNK